MDLQRALFVEYARTMREAQVFEAALQTVAAMELEIPTETLSADQMLERTERFFSRSIGWVQARLRVSPELASEIDALRGERNKLAHGYLVPYAWPETLDPDERRREEEFERALPENVQRELKVGAENLTREHKGQLRSAIGDLQQLRERFRLCNAGLLSRFMSHIPHVESWEEVERMAREVEG